MIDFQVVPLSNHPRDSQCLLKLLLKGCRNYTFSLETDIAFVCLQSFLGLPKRGLRRKVTVTVITINCAPDLCEGIIYCLWLFYRLSILIARTATDSVAYNGT